MDSREHNRGTESQDGHKNLLGLDIETTGLDPRKDSIVALALALEHKTLFTDMRDLPASTCADIMERWYNHTIIGHNLAFDLAFIHEKYGVGYPASTWDTMVAEQMLTAGILEDEANLQFVSLKYLNKYIDKSLTTTFTMDSEITDEQIQYVCDDVEAAYRIAFIQREKIKEQGLGKVWAIERAVMPVFAEMVRHGIRVDRDVIDPLLEETRRRHKVLEAELQEVLTPYVSWKRIEKRDEMQADLDFWIERYEKEKDRAEDHWIEIVGLGEDGWNKGMREVWRQNKWLDLTRNKKDNFPEGLRRYVKSHMKKWREEKNKDGKLINQRPPVPKLDESLINLNSPLQMKAALEALGIDIPDLRGQTLTITLPDVDEFQADILRKIIVYKKDEKLLSSFGDKMIERLDDENVLHGNFKQYGTATGRPTCTAPNMLQMPSKKTNPRFRSAFVPREGNLFVVADYSQIELRIMAELSGDPAMLKAFKDGLDLHTYTASLMFSVPFEDVTDKQRSTAKTINFGILYGMGPKKLRATLAEQGIDMSMDEAVEAVKNWKKAYKYAAERILEWQSMVMQVGYTATPFGRKRYFDLDTSDQYEIYGIQRAGANHVIQGTSADITKLAMVLIHEALEGMGTIVLQVYDEIVVEIPEYLAEWAKVVVHSCMSSAAEEVLKNVPVAVDAVISRSWNEDDEVS